ncbi:VOC family protein [Azohydromonas aeria]|uniref:VOC family protein n=1 Tax=Azohydromonas aeria TaxID=2590212 RepID=UPI0012F72751|nr:VOC family protein [Azohydromonas aeria]
MKLAYSILYSRDADAAARFYVGLLGLRVLDASPEFVSLALPNCILGIKRSAEPREIPGSQTIILAVDDIEGVYARLMGQATVTTPLNAADWGRNFAIADPDGNKVEFVDAAAV